MAIFRTSRHHQCCGSQTNISESLVTIFWVKNTYLSCQLAKTFCFIKNIIFNFVQIYRYQKIFGQKYLPLFCFCWIRDPGSGIRDPGNWRLKKIRIRRTGLPERWLQLWPVLGVERLLLLLGELLRHQRDNLRRRLLHRCGGIHCGKG